MKQSQSQSSAPFISPIRKLIFYNFDWSQVFGKNRFMGLGISLFAGLCFSLFSPLFNLATNDQFHTLKEGVPHLTVYTAFFYFSVSCFLVSAFLNISFLYHPILGLLESSFKAYASDWDGRSWAFLSGLLCGFGNGLQFMGGEAAGYAAADAVQVSRKSTCKDFTGGIFFPLEILTSQHTLSFIAGISIGEHILGSSCVQGIPRII